MNRGSVFGAMSRLEPPRPAAADTEVVPAAAVLDSCGDTPRAPGEDHLHAQESLAAGPVKQELVPLHIPDGREFRCSGTVQAEVLAAGTPATLKDSFG